MPLSVAKPVLRLGTQIFDYRISIIEIEYNIENEMQLTFNFQ